MSLGPVMLDVEGTSLTNADCERLLHPQTGGVILFSRNYELPEQVARLVDEIHALREPQLLVAVDQEGGRVQRFRDNFTRLPPVAELGLAYGQDPVRALVLSEKTGWLMAAELRGLGIDISFAPVLDLDRGLCPVIGDRAFHRDPDVVAELAHVYQRGMVRAGMQAVGKHFPGHGAVKEDSHLELPTDERRYADIRMEDLIPFERLIHQDLAGIMVAHVCYPDVDKSPAGFSSFWLKEVLRNELGFQGVIFSDDLSMVAAEQAGDYPARARAALSAGSDMVLVCNNPDAADEVLESLDDFTDPAANMRLARMHGKPAPGWDQLHLNPEWKNTVAAVKSYDKDPLLDMDM
jgi:beta-N-acetylhexosaminidase